MKFLVAMSVAAFAAAAHAAPPPADQSQVSQFACELAGDCGGDATVAAGASAEAATPGARAANVRGFTFKRTAPTGSPDARSPATPSASASASYEPAAPKRASAPVKGAADLRLDFASGSSELDDPDRQRLAALSTALSGPRLVSHRLRIEGHTDAKGSAARNLGALAPPRPVGRRLSRFDRGRPCPPRSRRLRLEAAAPRSPGQRRRQPPRDGGDARLVRLAGEQRADRWARLFRERRP